MSHELNWPVNHPEVGEKPSCVKTIFYTAETIFKQNERKNIFTSKDEYFDDLITVCYVIQYKDR